MTKIQFTEISSQFPGKRKEGVITHRCTSKLPLRPWPNPRALCEQGGAQPPPWKTCWNFFCVVGDPVAGIPSSYCWHDPGNHHSSLRCSPNNARFAGNDQKLEKARKHPPSTVGEGPSAADTWISDLPPPALREDKLPLFKALSAWYFVSVAVRHKHSVVHTNLFPEKAALLGGPGLSVSLQVTLRRRHTTLWATAGSGKSWQVPYPSSALLRWPCATKATNRKAPEAQRPGFGARRLTAVPMCGFSSTPPGN